MRAEIEPKADGSVALQLDGEAAQAVLASLIFAARFHEAIAPIACSMKLGLQVGNGRKERIRRCQ